MDTNKQQQDQHPETAEMIPDMSKKVGSAGVGAGSGSGSGSTYIHTAEQFRLRATELRDWIAGHEGKKPSNRGEGVDDQERKLYNFLTNCRNYWKYGQSWSQEKENIWTEVFGNLRLLESQRLFAKFANKVDNLHQWITKKKRYPQINSKSAEEKELCEFITECFAFRERGCSWSVEHDGIWTEKFGNLDIFNHKRIEEFSNNVKQLKKWIMKNGRIPARNRNDFDFDEHYLGEFIQKCRKERKSGNTAKWTPEKDQIWLETFHNYEMI